MLFHTAHLEAAGIAPKRIALTENQQRGHAPAAPKRPAAVQSQAADTTKRRKMLKPVAVVKSEMPEEENAGEGNSEGNGDGEMEALEVCKICISRPRADIRPQAEIRAERFRIERMAAQAGSLSALRCALDC